MKRTIFLALFIFLFASFGCVAEKTYTPSQNEVVVSSESVDLDGDGLWDYAVYDFSETSADGAVKIHRRIAVSTITTAEYTSLNNLTDLILLESDGYLEDADAERKQGEEACSNKIGLVGATCIDVTTCAKLCSANSVSCKKTAAEYGSFLGGSMIYYVQDTGYIASRIYDARKNVLELRKSSENEKNLYLEDIRDAVSKISEVNANALISNPKLALCGHADYGAADLAKAADVIGKYSTENSGYTYLITVDVTPVSAKGLENQMTGIEIEDSIPLDAITDVNAISSHLDITTEVKGDELDIKWSISEISSAGYILYYKFDSQTPPDELVNELSVPSVTIKTLDLSALGPTNAIFLFFLGLTGNYYFALGAAVALTLAILLIVYNIIVLAINLVIAQTSGRKLGYGVKKAFGRTQVRWKLDGAAGVILIAAGIFVSFSLAPEPFEVLTLTSSLEYLLSEPMAFIGTALSLLGVLMIYLAVENLVKIFLLERMYGVAVREERGKYLEDIATLKKQLELLKKLVKQYSAEEFEVTEEYNVLSSISNERLREFEKKLTPYSRTVLDEYLERVDTAIEKLEEKKKLADDNWGKWEESITGLLAEQNEVPASALINVPESLRSWALAKYTREKADEGLVLEQNVIKRKKLVPDVLLRDMVSSGMIKGGIILEKEMLLSSWFEKGKSMTVETALLFKLRSYLHSLQKTMDLDELVSYVSVGESTVFVVMKSADYTSAIYVNKDKFREAIETWKKKMTMLSK